MLERKILEYNLNATLSHVSDDCILELFKYWQERDYIFKCGGFHTIKKYDNWDIIFDGIINFDFTGGKYSITLGSLVNCKKIRLGSNVKSIVSLPNCLYANFMDCNFDHLPDMPNVLMFRFRGKKLRRVSLKKCIVMDIRETNVKHIDCEPLQIFTDSNPGKQYIYDGECYLLNAKCYGIKYDLFKVSIKEFNIRLSDSDTIDTYISEKIQKRETIFNAIHIDELSYYQKQSNEIVTTVQFVTCRGSDVRYLPTLAKCRYIEVSNNLLGIGALPNCEVFIGYCMLSYIPNISNVKIFDISSNVLQKIPLIPKCEYFKLDGANIKNIYDMPLCKYFHIYRNKCKVYMSNLYPELVDIRYTDIIDVKLQSCKKFYYQDSHSIPHDFPSIPKCKQCTIIIDNIYHLRDDDIMTFPKIPSDTLFYTNVKNYTFDSPRR